MTTIARSSTMTVTWSGCAAVILQGALDHSQDEGLVPEHIALTIEAALSPLLVKGAVMIVDRDTHPGQDAVIRTLTVPVVRTGDAKESIDELTDVCQRIGLAVSHSTNGGITTLVISQAKEDD